MRPGQVRLLVRDHAATHGVDRDRLGLVRALAAKDEPRASRVAHLGDREGDAIGIVQSIQMEET